MKLNLQRLVPAEKTLEKAAKFFLIALMGTLLYALVYLAFPGAPQSESDGFIFTRWWDQSQYKLMYESLLSLNFDKSHYNYGIGYPLANILLKPINLVEKINPFFLLNLGLFLIAVFSVYRLMAVATRNPALQLIATLIAMYPVVEYYVYSFNNVVTITAFLFLLRTILQPSGDKRRYFLLGFLVGMDLATRYSDILLLIPGLLYLFVTDLRSKRFQWRAWLSLVLPAFVWFLIVLAYHQVILGGIFHTPYDTHMRNINGTNVLDAQGYFPEKILISLYQFFVNPSYMEAPEIIEGFLPAYFSVPYILLVPLGLVILWMRYPARRLLVVLLGLTVLGVSMIYASFWAVQAGELKYYALRYFAFGFPAIAIVAFVAFMRVVETPLAALRDKTILITLLGTTLFLIGIQFFPKVNEKFLRFGTVPSSEMTLSGNPGATGTDLVTDNDPSTRFTTNQVRTPGQFLQIEFRTTKEVDQIRLNTTHYSQDRSQKLSFETSLDGQTFVAWKPTRIWYTGDDWFFNFEKTKAQFIKIINEDSSAGNWWSLSELSVKGTSKE